MANVVEKIDGHMKAAGIGKLHREKANLADMGELPRAIQGFIQRWPGVKSGLFLTGKRGTGKTHLAAAIARDQILRLRTVRFVVVTDLLLEIRETYTDGSQATEGDVIRKYAEVPILVLDDLGAEKTSPAVLTAYYTIIDRRYRECRPTIVTSNLSLDDLSKKLDERLASRLSEMCEVVRFDGADRRVK